MANQGRKKNKAEKAVRVIAITSGKGGVGKSNITLALALALSDRGKKVLIWDADLGLANIDVLLNLRPKYSINDLLKGNNTLNEIIVDGPGNIKIMPAASGILEMSELSEGQKARLLSEFDDWDEDLDFLLIDTAAGFGSNVVYFNLAAQERIVVVTNEPTSMTDAYALIKVLYNHYNQKNFYILPNQVESFEDAKKVFKVLASVADAHLSQVSMTLLGFIPKDDLLVKAVRKQQPFMLTHPDSELSKKVKDVADSLVARTVQDNTAGGLSFFLNRISRLQDMEEQHK